MTVSYSNVSVDDEISVLLTRTNQIIDELKTSVVTAGATDNSTTGNTIIVGTFSSDTLVANTELRGGNTSTSATLTIVSNVDIVPASGTNALLVGGSAVINSTGYWVGSSTGLKGQKGQTGDTGAAGATGAQGDKGQKGQTGTTGTTGDKGQKGQTGPSGTATAAGSDTYVQFNDGGTSLGGDADFVWNKTTNVLTIAGNVHTTYANATSFNTSGAIANTQGIFPTSNNVTAGDADQRWQLYATSGEFSNGVTPVSNSVGTALGSSTKRWVITANSVTCSGDVTAFSDERIKTDIQTLDNSLDIVKNLRGVSYYRKDNPADKKIGLIAQEVLTHLPEVVSVDDGGMYSLNYGNMVGLLINAIKELNEKVEILENKSCNCRK